MILDTGLIILLYLIYLDPYRWTSWDCYNRWVVLTGRCQYNRFSSWDWWRDVSGRHWWIWECIIIIHLSYIYIWVFLWGFIYLVSMLLTFWKLSMKCLSPSLGWTNGALLVRLFCSRIWGALTIFFRLTTLLWLKKQREKGVRLGEEFSMRNPCFKYYNMKIAELD